MYRLLFLMLFFMNVFVDVKAEVPSQLCRNICVNVETLDPHQVSSVPVKTIVLDLFEGLVRKGAENKTQPGVSDRWEISSDGKVYTFHLRDNAVWSNGDPVVAKHFVDAFKRAVDPKTAAKEAFYLWPIVEAKALTSGDQKDLNTLGVKAINERVLEIRLNQPVPYFLEILADLMAVPLHPSMLKPIDWSKPKSVVTNGAYKLTKFRINEEVALAKNPHYWDKDTVEIPQSLYKITAESRTIFQHYQSGGLHIASGMPEENYAWLQSNHPNEFKAATELGVYYYALNMTHPLFKENLKLRQALSTATDRTDVTDTVQPKLALRKALSSAIDREAIATKLIKGKKPALSFVPEGVSHYQEGVKTPDYLTKTSNISLARQCFKEAGYGDDKRLKVTILHSNGSASHKRIAVAIASMWKDILNIDVEMEGVEWKTVLSRREKKDYQVLAGSWVADYNDAEAFLGMFQTSVGKQNIPGFSNSVYDALMGEAAKTLDLEKRSGFLKKAEAILLHEAPVIPIYHTTSVALVNPKLKGWGQGYNLTRNLKFTD